MLGALVQCSPSKHIFFCSLLSLLYAYVSEWHVPWEASEKPCSAVPWWPHTAYGRNLLGNYTNLPMPRDTQPPCEGSSKTWTKHVDWTLVSRSNFQSRWPFHNFLGILTTYLICQIIDFQGTCDLCYYWVLWLRCQTWIGSQEACSLTRTQVWKLDGALAPRTSFRLKVTQIGSTVSFLL